jgi:RHS repeat-associated protein
MILLRSRGARGGLNETITSLFFLETKIARGPSRAAPQAGMCGMQRTTANRQPGIAVPALEMPSGGGRSGAPASAYTVEENLGAGTLPYPLDLPVARELTVELSLIYASGAGNGLFGIGFAANLPGFGLDLRFGVPRYDGNDPVNFAGETLVPALREEGGAWVRDTRAAVLNGQSWLVTRYVPRVEGDFTLIEYWAEPGTGVGGWRTLSPDNVESWYGRSAASRIADPADPRRVAEWLIEESRNAKGERILFSYRAEDRVNVPDQPAHRGRVVGANRYPDRIRYGNYQQGGAERFAFELIFDYGGYDLANPTAPPGPWPVRADPYSSYNAGFERRWYRLCHGILVLSCFPELNGGIAAPVRAYRFGYDQQPHGALLTAFEKVGYREADGALSLAALPALRLAYAPFQPEAGRFHALRTRAGLPAAPGPLAGDDFLLVDLDGAGLPGVLQSDAGAARYWAPLGDGHYDTVTTRPFPLDRDLGNPSLALMDLDADGALDLVVTAPARAGFYGGTEAGFAPFQPFAAAPTTLAQPRVQFVDLDGNGLADLVQFSGRTMLISPSLGAEGFAPAYPLPRPFPLAPPDDAAMRTEFASMFGDGLQHWVVIRDGEITCWPSLGRGRFGAPVAFNDAPSFGDGFDATRLRLVDTDGSGCADLIYLRPDRIDLYRNRNGSGFAPPLAIPLPWTFDSLDAATVADILGSGCAGLVLTQAAAPDTQGTAQYFYDFGVAGTPERPKPYLLIEADNNAGALTRIAYRSSTHEYLEDARTGQPWPTRLPFPVQLVTRMEVLEQVTGTRFVNCYRYHDGYYDGAEHAFRGFAYVERRDSEAHADFVQGGLFAAGRFSEPPAALHQPAALTRSWYDVGAPDPLGRLAKARQRQFFHGDPDAYDMPGTWLDPAIWDQARPLLRQARAATHGRVLREEVYGEDGGAAAAVPYRVTQTRFFVRLLQPDGPNPFAAFLAGDRETITYDYERAPDDPRVTHSFALNIDEYGHVTRDCAINYPRRPGKGSGGVPGRAPEQDVLGATANLDWPINTTTGMRWLGLACEARGFELQGLDPGPSGYFSFERLELQLAEALAAPIPYGTPFTPGARQARLYQWSRSYYWNDAQTEPLALGATGQRALLHHEAEAAFADGLLEAQPLFEAGLAAVPELDQGILPAALRARFAALAIALPEGARTDVAVRIPGQDWLVTDLDTGQAYPILAGTSALRVARRVLGEQAAGAAAAAGYAPEEGYWWNRGEIGSYATDPAQYYMLLESANGFAAPESMLYARTSIGYDSSWLYATTLTQWLSAEEGNITRLEMDYQALLPARVTDANLIVSESLYDPLGRTLATSLHKGAAGDTPLGDYIVRTGATFDDVLARPAYYLQGASSFVFDDPFAWRATGEPAAQITLRRETRVSDVPPGGSSAIQIEIAFADGLAREIERKRVSDPGLAIIRAASGQLTRTAAGAPLLAEVVERWWVSGRTVYNNKGRPAAVYLPYFSNTPQYERQADVDAAGLLPPPTRVRYDALGRAIRVDYPKGFFDRSVYESWCRRLFDQDDTVLQSDYYRTHIDNPDTPAAERAALAKAAMFADTPELMVLDPSGSPVRRVQILVQDEAGAPTPPSYLTTRLTLDAQARTIAIADPRLMAHEPPLDNVQYLLDMGGTKLLECAVDSGARAQLPDIFGNEVARRDGRGIELANSYDRLQRLTGISTRTQAFSAAPGPWREVERIAYGEDQADAQARNLRGHVYQCHDQAGIATYADYNIQDQAVTLERQLTELAQEIDCSDTPPAFEPVPLVSRWRFDALNRVVEETFPDGRGAVPRYGASSLMRALAVAEGGTVRPVVTDIEHDAADQRLRVVLANSAVSYFTYEPTTLRLSHIRTERPGPNGRGEPVLLQDRAYTYDPVGNVTQTADALRQTVYHNNQSVAPVCDYTTDSIYRLIRATGVQQPGLAARGTGAKGRDARDTRDASALENYLQSYRYDAGSNLTELRHSAASGNWTRRTEVAPLSNRARPEDTAAAYDANGNMTALGALAGMCWSWRNGLLGVTQIARPDGADDEAAFQYDASGLRLRKIVRRKISDSETELEETVYLGAYQRRRILRIAGGVGTLILERHDLRLLDDARYGEALAADDAGANRDAHDGGDLSPVPRSDGRRAFATEYRWSIDSRGRETAAVDTMLTRYPLQTLLGSITVELDGDANVVSDEEYYPYGDAAIFSAVSPEECVLKAYRYVGKERDAATGLYYFGARYYAPGFARWLSADPAGFGDGTNLYLYVGANPVTYTDPTGLGKTTKSKTQVKSDLAKAKGRLAKIEPRLKAAEAKALKSGKTYDINRAAKLRKERGTAKAAVTRLTNQLKKLQSAKNSKTIPTKPSFHNPGGPQVLLLPPTHPGPSAGTIITSPPGTAYIADLYSSKRTAQIESDVRNYAMMANRYIQTLTPKQLNCVATNRGTTGSIGYNAGQIATQERKLANNASPGTYASDQVVGHVPDVGATGVSYSPLGWFAQTKVSNSIVGGGLYAGRVITVYLVKEQDGNVYHYT